MDVKCVDQVKTDSYAWYCGDNCELVQAIPSDSIHYSISSIPFGSLYGYSNSLRCMSNNKTDAQFFEHMKFLINEWLRITMPGRLCSLHVMNLPTSKERDGFIGIRDFRGDVIRGMCEAGWIFASEVVIWKCPVTAVTRTKALGLLWKQLRKDSAMSRMGIPDYVLTFRKAGDNPERVTHTEDGYPVKKWQQVASPIWDFKYNAEQIGETERAEFWEWYFQNAINGWMDVNATKTLQSMKEEGDRSHVCPLQLDVIERCIDLWSNPGDTIFDPFGGIASTPYMALKMNRRGLGFELKKAYWDRGVKNLALAESEMNQAALF